MTDHIHFPVGVCGSSVFAVLQAGSMAAIGVLLARRGVIDAASKKTLAAVSMKVAIPCLLFSNLLTCPQGGPDQDPALCPELRDVLLTSYPFLLFPFMWVLLGMVVGSLVAWITCAPMKMRGVIMSACAFGNSTGLPIVLFSAISSANLTGLRPALQERQYLVMLAVYQITYPILQWGLGKWLLSVPAEADESRAGLPLPSPSAESSEFEHKNPPWLERMRTMREAAVASLTPPVVATLAALALGFFPILRELLVDIQDYDNDAVLGWGFNAISLFGQAAVPLNMMVLGAGLAKVPDFSKIHWPSTAAVVIAKLVFIPGIAFSCIFAMQVAGLIAKMQPTPSLQRSLVHVAFLVTATPTANNLAVMVELWGTADAKQALTTMIFLMYCLAPFFLTAWIAAVIEMSKLVSA